MAPPDLPSRPKGSPQSDVQEGAPELVKCSKSPEGSQSGANDNPAASSQKGSPRLPPDSSQPDAKDPLKQPLEATTGLEKRGKETGRPPPTGLQRTPRRLPTKPKGPPKGPPEGSQPSPKDLQKGPRKGSLEIGPEKGVQLPCDPRLEGPQTLQIPRFFDFGHPGRCSRVWGLPAPILGSIFGVPGCSRLNVDAKY